VDKASKSLRLMTIRSEGQFNTVVYEDQDLYRGQDRRDVILMAAEDMTALALKDDDLVTVNSPTGSMRSVRARTFPVRVGNAAMYCPEANVLVGRDVDPESGTPAFKHVKITVKAEGPPSGRELSSSPASRSHAKVGVGDLHKGVSLGTRLRSWIRHRRRPAIKSC